MMERACALAETSQCRTGCTARWPGSREGAGKRIDLVYSWGEQGFMSASISWQVCLKSAAQSKAVEGGQKRKGSTYFLSLAFSESRAWGKGKAFIMWVIIEPSRVRGLKHTDTSHDCLEPWSAELRCQ